MDSLPTTPTSMWRDIKILHIESTDVCQARCPLCARETDANFDTRQHHHLNIDQIKNHITDDHIAKLDKMFMCGNYGDPAAGRYTLDICRYFRMINHGITLGMNTNGAIQNTDWWKTLGAIFQRELDYVVFSIDGLEDTNHVYRRGVDWHKLMDNAQAYISTGARAHWDMLVYRHNEHQVDQCEQLARDLGFSWFRAKVSKRPLTGDLQHPVTWSPYKTQLRHISCHALNERSMYIDAQGRSHPCCWLGSRQTNFVVDFDEIQRSWTVDPDPVCSSACGTDHTQTNFERQWQRNIELQP